MRGFSRLAVLAFATLMLAANSKEMELEVGRSIFENGIGQDPIAIDIFGQRVESPGIFSCSACHGEYGAGGSEGGIVAPSIIVDERKSDVDVDAWLLQALEGQNASSPDVSANRMPRYALSIRDRRALASYIRTLPNPPIPGLTEDRLVIGLETTGMGLDEAGRTALMSEMSQLFAKVAGYGLFGRKIEIRDVTGLARQADVYAAITWDPRASIHAPLRLSVRPPSTAGGNPPCGSVQPSLIEQYLTLTNYLDRRNVRYRTIWDGEEPPFELAAEVREAVDGEADYDVDILLGRSPNELHGRPAYIFADLVGSLASATSASNMHLIVPARINAQEQAALDIQSRHKIEARAAGAIAMMKNGARALFTVLANSGRRISSRGACDSLSKSLRQLHGIDDMYDGTVIRIGS